MTKETACRGLLVFALLVLLVAGLCMILHGGEGWLPQWARGLGILVTLGLLVVVLGARGQE